MSIIFDAATDDVYQSDGSVIKRKIVAMEVMKTPAIVVSSAHLHFITTAALFYAIYRYVKLNECLIVSDSEECSLYSLLIIPFYYLPPSSILYPSSPSHYSSLFFLCVQWMNDAKNEVQRCEAFVCIWKGWRNMQISFFCALLTSSLTIPTTSRLALHFLSCHHHHFFYTIHFPFMTWT